MLPGTVDPDAALLDAFTTMYADAGVNEAIERALRRSTPPLFARDPRPATRDLRPATCDPRPATCDPRPATRDPLPTAPFPLDLAALAQRRRR